MHLRGLAVTFADQSSLLAQVIIDTICWKTVSFTMSIDTIGPDYYKSAIEH